MLDIDSEYDVIVIGSGSSACACAIRCGQLGLKTLCIDNTQISSPDQKLPSGIVKHPGCLETVILSESANLYFSILHNSNEHGIYVGSVSLDLQKMMGRKSHILEKLSQDITDQLRINKVNFINGKAKLMSPGKLELSSHINSEKLHLTAAHIILATESIPITVPCAPVDNKFILDSVAALNLTEVPKRLAILGAGVLGLELASIWNRLGAKTILLDAQESFLNLVDHQIAREAYKIFTQQGLDIQVGTRVISTNVSDNKVNIEYQDPDGNYIIQVDKLIVASGRKPNSENLAAPQANLLLDDNGYVHSNENYRTNLPNVYAIGDLTLMAPMLVHKGVSEGRFVAELIANKSPMPINYKIIPNVIYTDPEIAWIGQTEQTLNALGHATKIGTFYLDNNVKAIASDASDGMAKIITCAKSETILGVQLISKNASELIAEAALAMEFSANASDIESTMHPYPSFAQSLVNASLSILT